MIGVLGSSGFLGKNLCDKLKDLGLEHIGGSRRIFGDEHVDATDPREIEEWIKINHITKIVNLAAICGGIGLNKKDPFGLWHATTLITANVLKASIACHIEKVVMLGTVCSYAAECPTPFKESDLMNHGFPEPTNMPYGMSKLNGLIGAGAATKQYGLDVVNLIPVNMYGPHDHFDLENSHVIPALIRKMIEAEENGDRSMTVWGTGKASREFLYVEDCCDAIVRSLDATTDEMINVGNGIEVSIKELVEKIREHTGFNGEIVWDTDKPDGQMRRCLDVKKSEETLGHKSKVMLDEGIRKTVEWYKENRYGSHIS